MNLATLALSVLDVAQMIGLADACGIAVNGDAVAAWVSENTDPLDPKPATLFPSGVAFGASRLDGATEEVRKATCAAIAKNVSGLGFAR